MSDNLPIEVTEAEKIYEYNNVRIAVRQKDGFINLTAMCNAAGKKIGSYLELQRSLAFIHALSEEEGLPTEKIIEVRKGGHPTLQGTWGHRLLAYDVACWASPSFSIWVMKLADSWFLEHNSDVMIPISKSQSEFQAPLSESVSHLEALTQISSIYSQIIFGYKEERNLGNIQDKSSLIELRLNLTDLTLLSLSNLRNSISPNSNPLVLNLDQVKATIASYPSNNDRTANDMVSVNQRHKELFLLGQIPRELVYEEICNIGAKASKSYRLTYNNYPSKIKQTSDFGVVSKVNCYRRSDAINIIDPHIYNLFGILRVVQSNTDLSSASVI